MQLISAGLTNVTNGAISDYSLTFTPNTPVFDGDKLNLRFPAEITLPDWNEFKCTGDKNIFSMTCTKSNFNLVQVILRNVNSIVAGSSFRITFIGL